MNNETCEKCGYLLRNHKYKDDKYNCPEINIETQPSCTCTGTTTHSLGCPCYEEKCGEMIKTPHYDNGHNGGMWCAEPKPCKIHDKIEYIASLCNEDGSPLKKVEPAKTDWELDFDIEFEDCKVIHVFDTDQYKKIKEYVRNLLAKERADWTNEMIEWAEKNQTRCGKCDGAKDLQHTLACNFKQDLLKKLKELE